MIHFTDGQGRRIGVVKDQFVAVRPPGKGEYPPQFKSVLILQNAVMAVQETEDEVEAIVEKG